MAPCHDYTVAEFSIKVSQKPLVKFRMAIVDTVWDEVIRLKYLFIWCTTSTYGRVSDLTFTGKYAMVMPPLRGDAHGTRSRERLLLYFPVTGDVMRRVVGHRA
jgi:hypothetical protein